MKKVNKIILLLFVIVIEISCSPINYSNKFVSDRRGEDGVNSLRSKEYRIDSLFRNWNHEGAAGASIAVIQDGKILLSKGYGSANLEYNIPISKSTIFHVASVSKQFTAFSIALLEDQGKLSIDDDIRKYLPEMPDLGVTITIRNLLYHTSGLRDQFGLLELAGWRLDDVITQEQILRLIYNQEALNFEPGSEFQYSNSNYTLLAKIIEVVSGKSFSEWTEEMLFIPLGMKHTFFNESHEKIVKNRAYSYSLEDGGYRKRVLNYSTVGATSLFTTVEDLALWVENFQTKKVGNQKVINQMHRKDFLKDGKEIRYSYGQGISTYRGLPLIYHPGSDAGYRTYLCRFPSKGLAIVVLSNLSSFNAEEAAMQIADVYLEEDFNSQPILEDYTGNYEIEKHFIIGIEINENSLQAQILGKKDSHDVTHVQGDTFNIPTLKTILIFNRKPSGIINQVTVQKEGKTIVAPKLSGKNQQQKEQDQRIIPVVNYKEYQGKYIIKKPLVITITYQDNYLKGRITGKNDSHTLFPKTDSEFDVPSLNAKITFERDSSGLVKQLSFYKEGEKYIASKMDIRSHDKVDLKDYVGKYCSKELGTSYNFILSNDNLIAMHQRHKDIPLKLLEPNFLKGNEFFKDIEVIRDSKQKVLGIKVTSGLVRGLWFEKVK